MTTQQLYLFNCLYLIIMVVISAVTRATPRRIAGALAGATVSGAVALAIVKFGESAGWWHMAIRWKPYFLTLLWIDFALCGWVFLLTWRLARRFGARGLAIAACVAAVLGPLRDYRYLAVFPEWGTYAPGLAPILAVSGTYILLGMVGHGTMRWIAGPAGADHLARRHR